MILSPLADAKEEFDYKYDHPGEACRVMLSGLMLSAWQYKGQRLVAARCGH
jgi:hypothetical protein